MCQGRPASSNRFMIVDTHWTGEVVNGPDPSVCGTHVGTWMVGSKIVACQSSILPESQPQPGPFEPVGFSVSANPSSCDAASSRWACQLGTSLSSKVRSDTTNVVARSQRLGMPACEYCE